jgi:hypothetical protein
VFLLQTAQSAVVDTRDTDQLSGCAVVVIQPLRLFADDKSRGPSGSQDATEGSRPFNQTKRRVPSRISPCSAGLVEHPGKPWLYPPGRSRDKGSAAYEMYNVFETGDCRSCH